MYKTSSLFTFVVSVLEIVKAYQWKHSAILFEDTDLFFNLAGVNLVKDLRASDQTYGPLELKFTPEKSTDEDYKHLLTEASKRARGTVTLYQKYMCITLNIKRLKFELQQSSLSNFSLNSSLFPQKHWFITTHTIMQNTWKQHGLKNKLLKTYINSTPKVTE